MNWSGAIRPPGRVPPADQRLDAAEPSRLDVDHGLVVQLEFFPRDGVPQFVFRGLLRVRNLEQFRPGTPGNHFFHWL